MEMNKAEKNKDFYDEVYKKGGMYAKHYQASPYYKIWKKSIDLLKEIKNPDILEIGCGVGQFANMLFDQGFKDYKGFDYSDEAIKLAQQTNPQEREKFHVDSAYTSTIFRENYNTVIIFEVLEHLKEDMLVLNKIKSGVNVIFSVPNFDSASHVRYFKDKNEIVQRYNEIVEIQDVYGYPISSRNVIYLGYGRKK
jgi:2-polyprenyl-3-methyl-5-hydroxy-6-metoxy-1,4-benzoquinol methylase